MNRCPTCAAPDNGALSTDADACRDRWHTVSMPAICKGCGAKVWFDARTFHWMNDNRTPHTCPPVRAA